MIIFYHPTIYMTTTTNIGVWHIIIKIINIVATERLENRSKCVEKKIVFD